MTRPITPGLTLESLRIEAKRWLNAIKAQDDRARARLLAVCPDAPHRPVLRDLQYALALEFDSPNWTDLKRRVADAVVTRAGSRDEVLVRLLAAADAGETTQVAAILDRQPDLLNERGELRGHTGRRTALHFGVAHAAVVKCLLDRGADPNIRDDGDYAFPLHFAAEKHDFPVVRMLIEHGADPNGAGDLHELDVIGWATAFDYVTSNPELVSYLVAHGARHNILSAVATGETAVIRAIADESPAQLERGMDRTNHRRRPLHLAVVKKQVESLRTLLELGVNLESEDAAGLTALDQAALSGEAGMAEELLRTGAAVRLPAAVALGRTDDIERLVAQAPDCLRPGQRWGTLIVRASERGPGHIVDTLVRLGASVDVVDDSETAVDGTSPYSALHGAAWHGNLETIAVLLRHGANPRVRDGKYCATAAGWADYNNQSAARDLILEGPIDIFDAILFNRIDRVEDILRRDPAARNRPFREYASCGAEAADFLPLTAAQKLNRTEIARSLENQNPAPST